MSRLPFPVCATLLICAILAAYGCGEVRPPTGGGPVEPGVGDIIRSYGVWILRAGIAALVLAAILALVAPAVRPFCDEIALAGGAAVVCGAAFVWLGGNTWVLWSTILLAAAFAIWRYWHRIHRYLRQVK